MFKSNEKEDSNNYHDSEDTVIGRSIKIEGDLVSNGSIVIEGEVIGSLKTEQTLRIGENAKVKAEVKAKEAFISGHVDGNVSVDGKLELASTAELNGDIKAQILSIAAGAIFNGRSQMTEGNSVIQTKTDAKAEKND